jgi:hypothetical protein
MKRSSSFTVLVVLFAICFIVGSTSDLFARTDMKAMMEYRTKVNKFRNQPDKLIEIHMDYAVMLAKQAKADKNPNMFGERSGITQAIDSAKKELENAKNKLSADKVECLEKFIKDEQSEVEAIKASFFQDKLQSAEAPKDLYKKKDKEQWRKEIQDAWKKKYLDDEIIEIRFPNAQWEKKKGKEWNKAYSRWDKIDKSILKAAVIIKKDAKTAIIHPAFVNKDNLTGKVVIGVNTKKTYTAIEMLVENLM